MNGVDTERILSQLKDFQRRTVDYVYQCLYGEPSVRRFLIADEVGLGKTLVARGLIAKAVNHLLADGKRVDVVYICSNGDIARQNINRLNILEDNSFQLSTRITLMPTQIGNLDNSRVNLLSLTPGTSFDLKSSLGIVEERALLFYLLREEWKLTSDGARHLFRGYAGLESFCRCLARLDSNPNIDKRLATDFLTCVRSHDERLVAAGCKSLRELADELIPRFQHLSAKDSPPSDLTVHQASLIGDLRNLMAQACIHSIEPDIVILDEFQRFRSLLENNDPMSALAHHLFNYRDDGTEAKVILLSATPYKTYTMSHEEDENHHADFLRTLEFLFDDTARVEEIDCFLKEYRRELLRPQSDRTRILTLKHEIEARLRQVMVRTERLAVTPNRDGMLVNKPMPGLQLRPADLEAYVAYARVADELGDGDVLDYWKSAPYLLNFMEEYNLTRTLHNRLVKHDYGRLPEVIAGLGKHMITEQDLQAYAALDPQHARLNSLAADTVDRDLWKLLWLPPALPYYQLQGAFADAAKASVTKRLIFSSWRVAPKAMAALLSYEAERRMITAHESAARNTAEDRVRRRGLLRFAHSDGRNTGMSLMNLVYPSITLATSSDDRADPLSLPKHASWESMDPYFHYYSAIQAGDEQPTLNELRDKVEAAVKRFFVRVLKRHETTDTGPADESWYWAAPILLDLHYYPKSAAAWFEMADLANRWLRGPQEEDGDADDTGDDTQSAWSDHVAEARQLVDGTYELGRMPDDLPQVLAMIAVASPAVVTLRALSRVVGGEHTTMLPDIRTSAGAAAHAYLSLFNSPEAMGLIRSQAALPERCFDDTTPYWQMVLHYCAVGCLQAVTDEYCHVLRESLGLIGSQPGTAAEQIAGTVRRALRIRTVSLRAEELAPDQGRQTIELAPLRLRSRFAMRFGSDRGETDQQQVRAEQVRTAFNSPFWPFVLATTSVGQEGLDFHQYCHAVVHWNLPSNPVDLEQREGRVHRYKGHAIRKNLATSQSHAIGAGTRPHDPWEAMFASARRKSDTDLQPYWIWNVECGAQIERYVPAFPYSQDQQRFRELQRSLALYRLVFGQSSQEDIIAAIGADGDPEEIARMVTELQINLEPPETSH